MSQTKQFYCCFKFSFSSWSFSCRNVAGVKYLMFLTVLFIYFFRMCLVWLNAWRSSPGTIPSGLLSMHSNWPGRRVAAGSPLCTRLTSCKLLWGKSHLPAQSLASWILCNACEMLQWKYWVAFLLSSTGSSGMDCSCSAVEKWLLDTPISRLTAWLWTTPPCR